MLSSLALLLVAMSCNRGSSSEEKTPMAKESELALLMREMFAEGMSLKMSVMTGEEIEGLNRFEKIHDAIPTDHDVSGPLFDAFADAYINSIRLLEEADSSSVKYFNSMVDNCMSCHTEFCPGPKKRIKKLYIIEDKD